MSKTEEQAVIKAAREWWFRCVCIEYGKLLQECKHWEALGDALDDLGDMSEEERKGK